MPGTIIRTKMYTREDVEVHSDVYVMFGDNMLRRGSGGQAMACRGFYNIIGVPTKRRPDMNENSFFTDADINDAEIMSSINMAFGSAARILEGGGMIAWPQDGVGTGLSQLPKRAPKIQSHIEGKYEELEIMADNILTSYFICGAYGTVKGTVPQVLSDRG